MQLVVVAEGRKVPVRVELQVVQHQDAVGVERRLAGAAHDEGPYSPRSSCSVSLTWVWYQKVPASGTVNS